MSGGQEGSKGARGSKRERGGVRGSKGEQAVFEKKFNVQINVTP